MVSWWSVQRARVSAAGAAAACCCCDAPPGQAIRASQRAALPSPSALRPSPPCAVCAAPTCLPMSSASLRAVSVSCASFSRRDTSSTMMDTMHSASATTTHIHTQRMRHAARSDCWRRATAAARRLLPPACCCPHHDSSPAQAPMQSASLPRCPLPRRRRAAARLTLVAGLGKHQVQLPRQQPDELAVAELVCQRRALCQKLGAGRVRQSRLHLQPGGGGGARVGCCCCHAASCLRCCWRCRRQRCWPRRRQDRQQAPVRRLAGSPGRPVAAGGPCRSISAPAPHPAGPQCAARPRCASPPRTSQSGGWLPWRVELRCSRQVRRRGHC